MPADDHSDTAYPPKNGRPQGDPTDRTTQLVDRAVAGYREVVETRLTGIDRATELVARDLVSATAETDLAAQRAQAHIARDILKLRELIEARLDAMDKAAELLADTVGKVPSDVDKAVDALRQLLGARIDGMDIATKLLAESVAKFPSDLDRAVDSVRILIQSQLMNVQDVSKEKFLAIEGTFASNALALTAALAAQKEAAAEAKKSSDLAIDKSEKTTQETIRANDAKTASGISAQAAVMTDIKDRLIRLESGGVATAAAHTENRASSTFDQTDRIAQVVQNSTRLMGTRMTINAIIASVSAVVAVIAVIVVILKK